MNADDFGLSAKVNRGILACFHHGILRSTSLMPNGAAFDDAVRIAQETPNLGVGIHVSLVGEPCVAPPRELGALVDKDGMLPASYAAFARGYLTRRFTHREIRREVQAQLQRVLDAGIQPTHLDSHQHVHLLPGVFAIAVAAARAANIRVIRVPHERGLPHRFDARSLQLRALIFLCRRAKLQAQAAGLHVVSQFQGLGVSGALGEAALLHLIGRTRHGVNEIMAHPGFSDAAQHEKYPWGYDWEAEAQALQAPAVRELVNARGLRLAHFGEIEATEF